jgi:hypothetical protein
MFGTLGFPYVELIFLLCLFIPNILYGFRQPTDKVHLKENRVLLVLERVGQVGCTTSALIFSNFDMLDRQLWLVWLGAAVALMLLYIVSWVRYFNGKHLARDLYRPFLGIPIPLATLPVAAFFLLSVYGKVIWLLIDSIILGIGHIGIHAQHWKKIQNS